MMSEDLMLKLGLQDQAVEILAMELTTDTPSMFKNSRELVGYSMTRNAVEKGNRSILRLAYKNAGIGPMDIGVC